MPPATRGGYRAARAAKNRNLVPPLVFDVFVNGEYEHENEEETGTTKEVPDVVPDINW